MDTDVDLSTVNLARIKKSDVLSLGRWLANDKALSDFRQAISERLNRHFVVTEHDAEEVYSFGREMRHVFECRRNKELEFVMDPSHLPPKTFLVFTCGFGRSPFNVALELMSQSPRELRELVNDVSTKE